MVEQKAMKIHKLQLASIANRGKIVVLCSGTTFDLTSKTHMWMITNQTTFYHYHSVT